MIIPNRIETVDSRIKQMLMTCYLDDKRSFSKFLKATTNEMVKKEILKYWESIPNRLIKKQCDVDFEKKEVHSPSDLIQKRPRNRISKQQTEVYFPLSLRGEKVIKRFLRGDYSEKNRSAALLLYRMYDPDAVNSFIDSLQEKKLSKVIEPSVEPSIELSEKALRKERRKRIRREIKERMQAAMASISSKKKTNEVVCHTVPWEAIVFMNRYILIYDSLFNGEVILKSKTPFSVACESSQEIYNSIKNLFVERLPNIRVYVRNGRMVGLESTLELEKAVRILQNIDCYENWDVDDSPLIFPSSFRTLPFIDNSKVLRDLRKRKSKYFDFLVANQARDRKVVPCKELLYYRTNESEEDAFIFILKSYHSKRLSLVFENVNVARSTIVFVVEKNSFEQALRTIFDFARSREVNKRQRLHYRRFDFTDNGILHYECINHTSLGEWKEKIMLVGC